MDDEPFQESSHLNRLIRGRPSRRLYEHILYSLRFQAPCLIVRTHETASLVARSAKRSMSRHALISTVCERKANPTPKAMTPPWMLFCKLVTRLEDVFGPYNI